MLAHSMTTLTMVSRDMTQCKDAGTAMYAQDTGCVVQRGPQRQT